MKSNGSIRFEQRAGGRTVLGWLAAISILHLHELAIALQNQLAVEDAADVGYTHGFSFLPQLTANRSGDRSQLLGGVVQDMHGNLIAGDSRLIDQASKRSDP